MKLKFLPGLMLASAVAQAAAPIDGWYSNVFGGFAWIPDNLNTVYFGNQLDRARYGVGFDAGGAIGFKSLPMRYELQFTYLKARNRKFLINNLPLFIMDGYASASLGMANVYYDFPDMLPAISPYLGAGVGYGYFTTVVGGRSAFLVPFFFKATDSSFAWQATGGLTYNFAENFALNVDYRYVSSTRLRKTGKAFTSSLIELGVTYRFDDVTYK